MRKLVAIALMAGAALVGAPGTGADPAPNTNEAGTILPLAEADIARQLDGKQVQLQVKRLNVAAPWAFLYARMQEPDGRPIDYRDTPRATAAAHGGASATYAGLFHRDSDSTWQLVTSAVGPTDVAWYHWDRDYGAPAELFAGTY